MPAQAAAGCNTTTPDLGVTVTCVTPGTETIVVPAGATQANVVVIGGGGGSGGAGSGRNSGAGGNAAVVSTTIDVVAASLFVKVAAGGRADSKGGGGGGYSSISQVVLGSDSPMVIAGGGGGGAQGLTLSGGNGGSGGNAAAGGTAAGGDGGDGPPNGNFAGGKGGSDGIGGASSGGFYSAAGVNWSAGGAGGAVSDYAPGGGAGYGGGASGERQSLAADGASGGGAGGSFADPVYTTTVTYSTADRSGTAPFHGAGGLSVINEVGRAGFVGKVEITFLAPPPTPTSVAGVGINDAINLSWVAPIELTGITGYQVQRATSVDGSYEDALGGCGVATTQTSTATTCQATELINGSTYFFKVRAFDGTTWTDYSAASEGITPQFSGFVTVGSAPWGVTISPDGAKAYVGNSNSGTVSVIDLSTNEVSDTINTANGAAGVVINSAGTEMYVGNFEFTGPGSVSKVNIVDNTVLRTDTADCSYAGPLQMSPKLMGTKLLYTCRNDIRSMNTSASPMTTQQIRGADEYGDLVVLDSNSYVYINTFRNQVVRATLSGSTWTFPWSFALASTPYSLAISPDGLTGVSGSLVTGTLTFFDVSTGDIIGAMNVSSGGDMTSIAYDPTGSTIYVTNKARNSVVVVDVASRVELGTIPVGAGPQRIALTPSGNKAVVTNNASNTVSVFDITLQAALTPTFGVVTRTVDGYTKQISNFDADYVWGASSSSGSASVDGSGVLYVSGLTPGGFATATVHAARFGYAVGSATTGGDALAAAVIPTFGIPASTVNGFTVEILNWEPHVTYSLSTSFGAASEIVNKFVTVTGLIAGQSATLTVDTSRDGYADGQGQVTSSASAGVPSAPTIFLAGAGDGQASVTWFTPERDGGSAIISYTVTASPGGFSCTTPNGSTNTCVVTGLTNGVSYTFTVTALNNVGVGPASAAFGPITPRPAPVAPDAPTEVAGIAGDGLVDVSWLAPANNGGATIEGYQVQVATSATGVYTNAQGGCAPASTDSWPGVECQATGLVNGQTYFFKVRAQNPVDWGSYSLASSAVTPLAPPIPPIPTPPTPGGGGVPTPVEDQTPLQPTLLIPQEPTDSAKEVPSPKPSQGEATNTVVKSYTIEFSSGSAQLSAKTKQALDKIAQQSRLAARATTFASARLTRKGATFANRKLAEQRTRQVCSYLRSVKLKGSCSRKTWILKPGKKSIGPNIVVRMRATARQ